MTLTTAPRQTIIVAGLGYGDESKGATVDYLAAALPVPGSSSYQSATLDVLALDDAALKLLAAFASCSIIAIAGGLLGAFWPEESAA